MSYPTQGLVESEIQGWTRIEALLELYDRAIVSIECMQETAVEGTKERFTKYQLDAYRYLYGIASGLDTEKSEVAQNVARLLSFVLLKLQESEFDLALRFVRQLRDSFDAIKEDAIESERNGGIPPLQDSPMLNTEA